MSLTVLATVIVAFYFVLWFFDSFLKSCLHYPYYAFLEGTGLKVGILNFSWKTTAFNRLLFRWGKKVSTFLKIWFTYGYIFSIFVFMPLSMWIVFSTIAGNVWAADKSVSSADIETVVPGINLPPGDIWFYFTALAVSSVIHELGHALAAVQEDVQLVTVGFYVLAIIPIAFVELNSDQLNSLSAMRRLKIFCAGVWHNAACGFIAFVLLFSVSHIFRFGYEIGSGIRVVEFNSASPLKGDRGLVLGDQITAINNCKVSNNKDWYSCVFLTNVDQFGLCVTGDFISNHDQIVDVLHKENDLIDCCPGEDKQSLCFEYLESSFKEVDVANQYSCLRPRAIINEKFIQCTMEKPCPHKNYCLKPLLNNESHLFIIEIHSKDPVLYIGSPFDFSSVRIDHYLPKFIIFEVFSPQSIEKLFEYIFTFSLGLGIVNILPCFATDGHKIAGSIIQIVANKFNKDKEFVNLITVCVVSIGSLITYSCLAYLFLKTLISAV